VAASPDFAPALEALLAATPLKQDLACVRLRPPRPPRPCSLPREGEGGLARVIVAPPQLTDVPVRRETVTVTEAIATLASTPPSDALCAQRPAQVALAMLGGLAAGVQPPPPSPAEQPQAAGPLPEHRTNKVRAMLCALRRVGGSETDPRRCRQSVHPSCGVVALSRRHARVGRRWRWRWPVALMHHDGCALSGGLAAAAPLGPSGAGTAIAAYKRGSGAVGADGDGAAHARGTGVGPAGTAVSQPAINLVDEPPPISDA
jgi:hypothetical protein